MEETSNNFFQKFGLGVTNSDVQVGETYPIYGMITKILDGTPGAVVVELNFSIKANLTVPDEKKVELLRERAFEPGIFISVVKTKENGVEVDCNTVIFGKKQNSDLN